MKSVIALALMLSCEVFAQVQQNEMCDISSKSGGLYLMPQGGEIARIKKDTIILLLLSTGEKKKCRLDHDVYPYIEEIEKGKFVATDLRTGQKVLRSNGEFFEVNMTSPD